MKTSSVINLNKNKHLDVVDFIVLSMLFIFPVFFCGRIVCLVNKYTSSFLYLMNVNTLILTLYLVLSKGSIEMGILLVKKGTRETCLMAPWLP